MAKHITAIPATTRCPRPFELSPKNKRRVAGYARVSTNNEEQFSSYEEQVGYYTALIRSKPDWEFAGIYTDEGISGTSTKHREGFNRMIEDAINGQIDLIVTKSVSRFARNTVDSLTAIRRLKERGVEVFFEKENIRTMDSKGELFITVMSSLAQEESRSISENCTWGQRKRFADGRASVAYSRFCGYDRGENGTFIINKKEAATIKRIYGMFLHGYTMGGIAKSLTAEGIPAPCGGGVWRTSVIRHILKNEKYKGDALLQKTFTVDFLTKQVKINEGELPQYYVEEHHEPIIRPIVFDLTQKELERRSQIGWYSGRIPVFAGKLRCGCCGGWYHSKTEREEVGGQKTVWRCRKGCEGSVTEEEIEQAFIKAANLLITDRNNILQNRKQQKAISADMENLQKEIGTLRESAGMLGGELHDMLFEANRSFQAQEEFSSCVLEKDNESQKIKNRIWRLTQEIKEKEMRSFVLEQFTRELEKQRQPLHRFNKRLFFGFVEYVTVGKNDPFLFTMRSSRNITIRR